MLCQVVTLILMVFLMQMCPVQSLPESPYRASMQQVAANLTYSYTTLHVSCKEKRLHILEDLQGGVSSGWNV